jgi:hypothetical protein
MTMSPPVKVGDLEWHHTLRNGKQQKEKSLQN